MIRQIQNTDYSRESDGGINKSRCYICSSTFDGEGYLTREVQRSQARVLPQRLGQLRRSPVPDVVLYITSDICLTKGVVTCEQKGKRIRFCALTVYFKGPQGRVLPQRPGQSHSTQVPDVVLYVSSQAIFV